MADYTQVYIDNDMAKLNTVLQTLVTNGIVGAVDYTQDTYATFTFYADAEKTTEVFRITQQRGYVNTTVNYTFTATASDGTTLSSTAATTSAGGSNITGYQICYGFACSSGVLLEIVSNEYTYPYFWVLITKNQNGAPVFVWTNCTSANNVSTSQILTNMNTEYIVAASDVAPLNTLGRATPATRNQTVLSPFFSCSDVGDTSYTPDAGRIIAGGMNRFIYDHTAHEITFDGATWLTNGYWALKVG